MTLLDFTTKLLSHMGVEHTRVEIDDAADAVIIRLHLPEEESGMLIGRGGQTLESLQRLIRLLFQKDQDKPILVTVNDYLDRRMEYLKNLAVKSAEVVMRTGVQKLFRLPAWERRIIHMTLVDHPSVESVSEGHGDERVLYIRLKSGVSVS